MTRYIVIKTVAKAQFDVDYNEWDVVDIVEKNGVLHLIIAIEVDE